MCLGDVWLETSVVWAVVLVDKYQLYTILLLLISLTNFRRVLNIVCILLCISPASDCGLPTFRNPLSVPALENGTDRGFQNVGKPQSDAGEIPKRIHTRYFVIMGICWNRLRIAYNLCHYFYFILFHIYINLLMLFAGFRVFAIVLLLHCFLSVILFCFLFVMFPYCTFVLLLPCICVFMLAL